MRFDDLQLEIFPGNSSTSELVELAVRRENASEDMALAIGKYGALNFRTTQLAGYSIWQTSFLIKEPVRLRVTGNTACTFLWIVWKNTLRYRINQGPENQIMADYYNVYYLPSIDWELIFNQPGEYETFNILFSDHSDWDITMISPNASLFFERVRNKEIALLNSAHRRLTGTMRTLVAKMIRGPFEDTNRHQFYENLALDLRVELFRDMSINVLSMRTSFMSREAKQLYALRDEIAAHPEHSYQLKDLAKKAGMNENKLEIAFKELFGTTVFRFIQEERMENARRQLISGHYSVKEVAAKAGYKNTAGFTHAFKKYFGFPPSHANR